MGSKKEMVPRTGAKLSHFHLLEVSAYLAPTEIHEAELRILKDIPKNGAQDWT